MNRTALLTVSLALAGLAGPAAAQGPPRASALTVSVLERMDRRLDEANRQMSRDLQEIRAVQKEMLRELERVERQYEGLDRRVAALEKAAADRPAATPAVVDPTVVTVGLGGPAGPAAAAAKGVPPGFSTGPAATSAPTPSAVVPAAAAPTPVPAPPPWVHPPVYYVVVPYGPPCGRR